MKFLGVPRANLTPIASKRKEWFPLTFIFNLIDRLFQLYQIALVVYILMSWFPGAYNTAVGRFLGRICEPFLSIFRRFIPAIAGIDF